MSIRHNRKAARGQWKTSLQNQKEELVSERDSVRWSALTYAMHSIPRDGRTASRRWWVKKVPDYLLRMINDYLSNRRVIYEGEKWSLKEEMTCGVPQGSRVKPSVWNVMYGDFLRMDLPAETSIIGFADDALVVCARAEDRWESTACKALGGEQKPWYGSWKDYGFSS